MKTLIATATAGGGHLAAAAALEEAWRELRPDDTVEVLDVVKYFSPLHRKVHADGYLKIVERAPELWGLMFNKTDDPAVARRLTRWRRLFPSHSRTQLARHFKRSAPDAVLCTHYAPLEVLGSVRGESTAPFVASVVTDFEAHALWMDDCVDLYCVAAEHTKARLVARGVSGVKVFVSGIPIAARFRARIEPGHVRKRMGLRDDQPVLLVLSGGFGTGPIDGILQELDKVESMFQTVVVTGRNEELRRALACADRRHPTHVLGFATNIQELMSTADLVISKPGGLTTSEALSLGKPLLVVNPIPGQESANSDFLLEHGAGTKVNRVEDIAHKVGQLLGSRKLAEMRQAAKALGKPEAALEICRVVAGRVSERERFAREARREVRE